MKHRFDRPSILLFAACAGALLLHFWPMAYWSGTTLVFLRFTAAFCAQRLVCRTAKHPFVRLLPLALCAGLAAWGGWLFFTSPAWADASLLWYVLDYCSPAAGCLLALLPGKGR